MIGYVFARRYRVEELIGTGGMARVYRAVDLKDGSNVAIKILKPEFNSDTEFVRRFQREAMAAQSMLHPNIIKVIGVGEEHGCKFIVMEYVDGMTIKDMIRQNGALDLRHTLDYAVQIARAIEHAHRGHIIHRDIKSQNIMVDGRGIVKVADFGIARATNAATVTANDSGVLGSVHYFSPEQARGEVADEQSDIYSLGVVIYEMATGHLPFDGEQPVTIALKHIQEAPAPITDYDATLPAALDKIVRKALSKQKQQRYASAIEMEEDLAMVVEHPDGAYVDFDDSQPVEPEPPLELSGSGRSLAPTEKVDSSRIAHPLRWVLGAAGAILLIVVLAVGGSALARKSARAQLERELSYMVGMETSQALAALTSTGYGVVVSPAYSDTAARDTIISYQVQNHDQKIQIVLSSSSGPETSQMPNLYGMTLEQAQQALYPLGIEIGEASYEQSDEPLDADRIFEQSVAPQETVKNGQRVTIKLVSPDPQAQMPSVLGMQLEAAKELLEQNHLTVGSVSQIIADDIVEGAVVEQSLEEGAKVDYGTAVDLIVAAKPDHVYTKTVSFVLEIPSGGAEVVIYHNYGDVSQELVREQCAQGAKSYTFNLESRTGEPAQLVIYIGGVKFNTIDVAFDEAGA